MGFTELEAYAIDLCNALVESYEQVAVELLSYDTLLKLFLVTEDFNASSFNSQGLIAFFTTPRDTAVWEWLHHQYMSRGKAVSFDDFKCSFDFLLWNENEDRLDGGPKIRLL